MENTLLKQEENSSSSQTERIIFSKDVSPCTINEIWDNLYMQVIEIEEKNKPLIAELNLQKSKISKADKSGRKAHLNQQINILKEEIELISEIVMIQYDNAVEDFIRKIIDHIRKEEGLLSEEDDIREAFITLCDGRMHDYNGGKTWTEPIINQVIKLLKENEVIETETKTQIGYAPDHPWYYKVGGRILLPDEIKPINRHIDNWMPSYEKFKPVKLEETRKKVYADLDKDIKRYNEIAEKGLDAISETDKRLDPEMSLFTALSLKHNHIVSGKAMIAAIDLLLEQKSAHIQVQLSLF